MFKSCSWRIGDLQLNTSSVSHSAKTIYHYDERCSSVDVVIFEQGFRFHKSSFNFKSCKILILILILSLAKFEL